MEKSLEIIGKKVTYAISGEMVRIQDCIEVTKEMRGLVESDFELVILDLSKCLGATASFCGFLISLAKSAKTRHTRFAIVAASSSPAYEVLRTMHVDSTIDIYPSSRQLFEDYSSTHAPAA